MIMHFVQAPCLCCPFLTTFTSFCDFKSCSLIFCDKFASFSALLISIFWTIPSDCFTGVAIFVSGVWLISADFVSVGDLTLDGFSGCFKPFFGLSGSQGFTSTSLAIESLLFSLGKTCWGKVLASGWVSSFLGASISFFGNVLTNSCLFLMRML